MEFKADKDDRLAFKDETFGQEVATIVNSAVEDIFGPGLTYNFQKVGQWADNICDRVLSDLRRLPMPRKYVVTAHFIQKNGAGFAHSANALWDEKVDGSYVYEKENSSMICICCVFGLPL